MPIAVVKKLWGLSLFGGRQEERIAAETGRQISLPALFLGLSLVGLALLHVWLRLQVIQLGYVLSTTSKVQSQLGQENRELQLELATLTSPDRLEERARTRLGLREPEKDQVVILP